MNTEVKNAESDSVVPEVRSESTGDRAPEKAEMGKYRRNGNVARLPKAVRDEINLMIQDGFTYREIIEELGEDGEGLDVSNLSRWKDGGYQDWLVEQAFIERTRTRQETPGEMVRDFDATEVNHAALQLGTLQIFEALRDLSSSVPSPAREEPKEVSGVEPSRPNESEHAGERVSSLSAPKEAPGTGRDSSSGLTSSALERSRTRLDFRLGGDCTAFARLINALARASRETMQLQRYREACAKAREALQGLKDPERKLSESETRTIVRKVDEILGLS